MLLVESLIAPADARTRQGAASRPKHGLAGAVRLVEVEKV